MSSITVGTVSTEKYTTRSSDLLRRTGELMFSHFRPLIKNSIFESSWSIFNTYSMAIYVILHL